MYEGVVLRTRQPRMYTDRKPKGRDKRGRRTHVRVKGVVMSRVRAVYVYVLLRVCVCVYVGVSDS